MKKILVLTTHQKYLNELKALYDAYVNNDITFAEYHNLKRTLVRASTFEVDVRLNIDGFFGFFWNNISLN